MHKVTSILLLCISVYMYKGHTDSIINPISSTVSEKAVTSALPNLTSSFLINTPPPAIGIGNFIIFATLNLTTNQVIISSSPYNSSNQQIIDVISAPSGITFQSVSLSSDTIYVNNFVVTIQATNSTYIKVYTTLPKIKSFFELTAASNQQGPVVDVASLMCSNMVFTSYLQASTLSPTEYYPYLSTNYFNVTGNFQLSQVKAKSNTSLAIDSIVFTNPADPTFRIIGTAYIDINSDVHLIIINAPSSNQVNIVKDTTILSGIGASNISLIMINNTQQIIGNIYNPLAVPILYLISFIANDGSLKLVTVNSSFQVVNILTLSSNAAITPIVATNKIFAQKPTPGWPFVAAWVENTTQPYASWGIIDGRGNVSFPSGMRQALQSPATLPNAIMDNRGGVVVATIAQNGGNVSAGTLMLNATTPSAQGLFSLVYQGNPGDPTTPATLVYNALPNKISIITKGLNGLLLLRVVAAIYNEADALKRDGQLYNNALYLPFLQ